MSEAITIDSNLDITLSESEHLSKHNICEGVCDKHHGEVRIFRVFSKDGGNDWGYFSYCEEAVKQEVEKFYLLTQYQYSQIAK